MFRHTLYFVATLLAVSVVGLAGEPSRQDATKAVEVRRITIGEAEKLVRQHIKELKEKAIPLKELTTDVVWGKLKVQVFKIKYSEGLPTQAAFVVKQGRVIPIGMDFGGDGVNSLCVADLKGDGRPFLVFSYAWGSGIHRSQIGALDCLAKEPREITASQSLVLDFAHDWSVRALDARTARVEGGGVSFGNLELEEKDGKTTLRIRIPDDLPVNIKKNVK